MKRRQSLSALSLLGAAPLLLSACAAPSAAPDGLQKPSTLLRGTGSVLLVEVALTVIGAGMVWVIVRGWGAAGHFPPLPPGPTRQVPAA